MYIALRNQLNSKETNEDQRNSKEIHAQTWKFPKENFTVDEEKLMLSEVLGFLVKFIMNNHIYVFNGDVYLQTDEGSIGIRLTGLLADIIMIIWCMKFSDQLNCLLEF